MALHSYFEAERSNTASSTASPCEIGSSPIDMDALSYSETYSSSLISWSHIASSTASLFDMSYLSINLDALPDSETYSFSSLTPSSNTANSIASTCDISVLLRTLDGLPSSDEASSTASSCDMSSLSMDIDYFLDAETDSFSSITSAFSQVGSDHNENAVMKLPLPLDALSRAETNSGIRLISSSDTASFTSSYGNLLGTMNVSVTNSSDNSAKSESGHSFSSKPRANSNDKGILNDNDIHSYFEAEGSNTVSSTASPCEIDSLPNDMAAHTDSETNLFSCLSQESLGWLKSEFLFSDGKTGGDSTKENSSIFTLSSHFIKNPLPDDKASVTNIVDRENECYSSSSIPATDFTNEDDPQQQRTSETSYNDSNIYFTSKETTNRLALSSKMQDSVLATMKEAVANTTSYNIAKSESDHSSSSIRKQVTVFTGDYPQQQRTSETSHNDSKLCFAGEETGKRLALASKQQDSLLGTMNVLVTNSSDNSAKSKGNHSISHKPTAYRNDKGILNNDNSALQMREEIPKKKKYVESNTYSKKTISDYKAKRRANFERMKGKKQHLNTAKLPDQAIQPTESGSDPAGKGSREAYECSNGCPEGKKICLCISRPLALKMGLAKDELVNALSWSLEQYIKPEIVAINKVWKKTKHMSSVKSKLKKIKRNENNQERPVCRENGKKHHKCYNCQKPTGDCNNSACSHCRCIKVSIQIPFGIWAYETMAWSQIKPDLMRRCNGDYQSKTKKE